METFNKNKTSIIALLVVIVAAGGYYLYQAPAPGASLVSDTSFQLQDDAQKILNTLNVLNNIKLESALAIFTDPVFVGLKHYPAEIIPQPLGRKNPFLPLFSAGSSKR